MAGFGVVGEKIGSQLVENKTNRVVDMFFDFR